MRVLIIEDNNSTAHSIELALAKVAIISDSVDTAADAYAVLKSYKYDMIILDLMLPDGNGLEILRQLRASKKPIPVLILSGLGSPEDKIQGLITGADDYLSKPFSIEELVARVKAIIRRSAGHPDSIVEIDDLKVNFDAHIAEIAGNKLYLTGKEQAILELLAIKKGQRVTKEHFLTHLYNGLDEPELKIIDVFVCRLRKKLMEASGGRNYIETIWGVGYELKHPNEINQPRKIATSNTA